jgi:peptidoglycan/LPS O-acetylase OafA/YrhL
VWPTLLVLLLALRARPRVLVGAVGALAVVATVWLQVAYERGYSEPELAYRPDLRVSGILIGTLVGLLHSYGMIPERARGAVRVATLVGTAYVLYYLAFPLTLPRFTIITLAIVVACLAFAAFVLQQARWPSAPYSALFELPALVWTGRASYVLYLVHVPVLRTLGSQVHTGPVVRWLLGGVITLALGAAVHEWVEKPALRLKERRGRVRAEH